MSIEPVEDDTRKYTVDEDRRLALQLQELSADCQAGKLWPIDIVLLRNIHARLFGGVRPHAGRFRRRDYGEEYLVFGPNRSIHREDVETELRKIFETCARSIASFEANPTDPGYTINAVRLAVWIHAQIIRVHPFLDGNGRSSRVLMNSVLVGLGLKPVAVEAVKQEYNEAMNLFLGPTKDLDVVVDLLLGLFDVAVSSD